MCGRTACTLCKNDLQQATRQYSFQDSLVPWVENYTWQQYIPNYNLSPGQISPVLLMSNAVNSKVEKTDIILFPMKWGLIPHWYKGEAKQYSVKTNNAQIESIVQKPTYKKPLIQGRRCVILADGFYEWKTHCGKKQPYFIQFPENNNVVYNRKWENKSEDGSWDGPRLLTIAGIYDVWKSDEFEELFSYSVITMGSSKTLSFVHHRMPAILDGKEQVQMWLDSKNISYAKALANIKAVEKLNLYPVSTEVNNSRNNDINCVKPIILNTSNLVDNTTSSQASITNWFKRKPHPEDQIESKKMKM